MRIQDAAFPFVPFVPVEPPFSQVMGLTFKNCIGIAAGIDRDGSVLPAVAGLHTGHIEIGTVTDPRALKIPLARHADAPRIGVNIGSAKAGFSHEVLSDYRDCLSSALPVADYVVLNFSSEAARRTVNSDGGHRVVSMARHEISRWHAWNSARIPLLAKLPAGAPGEDLPVTPSIAAELDGFVISGEHPQRIAEIRAAFPDHGIVSVGGIRCGADVRIRKSAGCDLVQVHGIFAQGGAAAVARLLSDSEGGFER